MKWANIQHLSSSHFRSNFVYFWQSKMARFWAFYSNEHLYRSEIDTHTPTITHIISFFFPPSVRGRGEIWWYIYRTLDERTGRSLSCVRLPMCSRLSPSGKTDYTLGLTISFSLLFHIFFKDRRFYVSPLLLYRSDVCVSIYTVSIHLLCFSLCVSAKKSLLFIQEPSATHLDCW